MDIARQTDERLRCALNANQPSRERLCLAVLALDRNYTDVKSRRPEGGPDGGRDLQCTRNSQLCFGAVGFTNNVSDSKEEKSAAKKKYKSDLKAAIAAEPNLRAFVFFTNVDLTPKENTTLCDWGRKQGISFVDIYYRERIRHVLDSPEGLAIRYQYLSMPLSEAEQASFFSRFGNDLEKIVRGGFDRVEQKIDALAFTNWKNGTIKNISLKLEFAKGEIAQSEKPEHFRVFLELQSVVHEERSIFIGGRDDYWKATNDVWYVGTKTFFWRQKVPTPESVWVPHSGGKVGSPITSSLNFGAKWFPRSPVLVDEFEGLGFQIHVTENLIERIASIQLVVDSYVLFERKMTPERWVKVSSRNNSKWPDTLTPDEEKLAWCHWGEMCTWLNLEDPPPKLK